MARRALKIFLVRTYDSAVILWIALIRPNHEVFLQCYCVISTFSQCHVFESGAFFWRNSILGLRTLEGLVDLKVQGRGAMNLSLKFQPLLDE